MLITQKIINELTYNIIGACIEVHKLVGPVCMKQYIINALKRIYFKKYKFQIRVRNSFNYKGEQIDCKVKCF